MLRFGVHDETTRLIWAFLDLLEYPMLPKPSDHERWEDLRCLLETALNPTDTQSL